MPLARLPRRKKKSKKDKPKDARDKFLKQLRLRDSDDRQRTQQELMLVRFHCLMITIFNSFGTHTLSLY